MVRHPTCGVRPAGGVPVAAQDGAGCAITHAVLSGMGDVLRFTCRVSVCVDARRVDGMPR